MAVGFGGWQYRDQLVSVVNQNRGPPKTENQINEVGGDSFLNRFVLYESGAARFEFGDDYGCYERIAVGDNPNLRESNLGVWGLPRNGELIVDLKSAVSRTGDPSNEFWLESLGGTDSYCFSGLGISMSFTVPQGWIE